MMTTIKHPLEDYVWVFVGCGGTFYAASPYLAVLCKRYCKTPLIIIDPKGVRESDHGRQWTGWTLGSSKVGAASEMLNDRSQRSESILIGESFSSDDRILSATTEGKPVIAIVNVDNNAARLEVAEWLAGRVSDGIMIVSGCERTFGQCYPGIWKDGEPVYDWRENHKDVVQDSSSSPSNPCNAQDVRANALTGVLVGMCIEDVALMMANKVDGMDVVEFYWSVTDGPLGALRMWTTQVPCKKGGVVL
jgi:hypothetical protein